MKDELDKELCERFPKIFRDRHASMQETCMCWGIAVGDGWYKIIKNTCSLIQNHINWTRESRARAIKYNRALKRALKGDLKGLENYHSYGDALSAWGRKRIQEDIEAAEYKEVPEACSQVVATQVKEKFGTLRFYYNGGDEFVHGVVRMAEAMTGSTCEECANPGKSAGDGWIRVLCDKCDKAFKKQRKERFK